MATVYEKDLMPRLSREMGDTDTSNLYFSADQLFSAINDSLVDFNVKSPDQQYAVVGSGNTAYFSPDPSADDQQLIVLFAAMALTRGEIQKSARNAFSHSNPAGRTDLSAIPEALDRQLARLEQKIDDLLTNRSKRLVEEELDTCGIELKGKPTETAEGVGIVTIETTN